ncbi:hypothetical protein [Paraburkholderia kirstenboschensis]|uniref:Uncharacterized protein n=1 Tax=Paraburkholderia kirstenboschensis TaxID=1245436 RepID=A0ABZ0ECM6_9BURK|nr:hypothetical protein [Paraburkholderia kirstenboschensis]WOD13958.1 hypothetical protein RW095_08595 [Paraburkholderia kirstenboschensis]
MAMHDHLTTNRTPVTFPDSRHQLTVRAKNHGLRVAAVWQVLMSVARDIENIRIAIDQSQGYEEITISFSRTSFESLKVMVDRLEKMSWVADIVLC